MRLWPPLRSLTHPATNLWLEGLCARCRCYEHIGTIKRYSIAAFVCLNHRIRAIRLVNPGFSHWLEQLPRLIELVVAPTEEALALRPHPSEPVGKYDDFIAEASANWPIQLDCSPALPEALAWADAAFGCETQALVASIACNLPAFSTVPPWAPLCCLPQSKLHHLNRLEGA